MSKWNISTTSTRAFCLSNLWYLAHHFQGTLSVSSADTLNIALQPHDVAVYLEAFHLCMEMRGVREAASATRTSFWRGAYDTNPALRSEFFAQCETTRSAT